MMLVPIFPMEEIQMNILRYHLLVAMLLALAACSSPPLTPTSVPAPTMVSSVPVVTIAPTVAPTNTVIPTLPPMNTPTPTNVPIATLVPKEVEVSFQSGNLTLRGFIWKPNGDGPFPAMLWNHGSEKTPGWLPDNAMEFVSKGYVFFIPHRRGQGRSPGPYILDQLATAKTADESSKMLVKLHETEQLQDQLAALAYLKTLNYVDKTKLAVGGCSYGGIQTVLGAEVKDTGYRAAVNFAGAAKSWKGSPDIRTRLLTAVRSTSVPIFFIQAENDVDLTPSNVLSEAMKDAGKAYKLKIFPSTGGDSQSGHDFCVTSPKVWGPEVFAFLSEYLK
jgi:dienelactone hydrolase